MCPTDCSGCVQQIVIFKFFIGLQENCWFAVHPVNQQRSEGEKVRYCVCEHCQPVGS